MRSLAHALQKASGKLFLLGFWHLLRALQWKNKADLLLIAVCKDLQPDKINRANWICYGDNIWGKHQHHTLVKSG
jgi:hypothetical protein